MSGYWLGVATPFMIVLGILLLWLAGSLFAADDPDRGHGVEPRYEPTARPMAGVPVFATPAATAMDERNTEVAVDACGQQQGRSRRPPWDPADE